MNHVTVSPAVIGVRAAAFPHRRGSVRDARAFVTSMLADHGRCEDAVLCVSELATNALVHAGGDRFRVVASYRPDRAYVAVVDSGGGHSVPHVADAGGCALSGRGLALVSSLSSAWGFVPTGYDGWHVWCELRDSDTTWRTEEGAV